MSDHAEVIAYSASRLAEREGEHRLAHPPAGTPAARSRPTSQDALSTVRSTAKSVPSSTCIPTSSPRRRTAKGSAQRAASTPPTAARRPARPPRPGPARPSPRPGAGRRPGRARRRPAAGPPGRRRRPRAPAAARDPAPEAEAEQRPDRAGPGPASLRVRRGLPVRRHERQHGWYVVICGDRRAVRVDARDGRQRDRTGCPRAGRGEDRATARAGVGLADAGHGGRADHPAPDAAARRAHAADGRGPAADAWWRSSSASCAGR